MIFHSFLGKMKSFKFFQKQNRAPLGAPIQNRPTLHITEPTTAETINSIQAQAIELFPSTEGMKLPYPVYTNKDIQEETVSFSSSEDIPETLEEDENYFDGKRTRETPPPVHLFKENNDLHNRPRFEI